MNDLNQCQFIGRLGGDVEMRYMPGGDAVASFSIAVGSQWKDKTSGEKKESVEWVSITAFGKLGEICGKYLLKGSQVFISGRLKTEKYKAKDGTDRYSTKVIAENMQMLGSKREESAPKEPAAKEYDSNPPGRPGGAPAKPKPASAFDDFESDQPF